jgi:hypothetical protein
MGLAVEFVDAIFCDENLICLEVLSARLRAVAARTSESLLEHKSGYRDATREISSLLQASGTCSIEKALGGRKKTTS